MSKRIGKENEEPRKRARLSEGKAVLSENQASRVEHAAESTKMTSKQAINAFKHVLQNAKRVGEYSVSGEATELPVLPNLHVKNFGLVSLPLNDSQANDLIKICAQAPFGRNQLTLIDKSVRDTYQLDPSQIDIKHPDWTRQLNLLVERVANEMGCSNLNVKAKLYKMLLYKKDGHFLKHRDTEKEKNMFATLVIQLPSVYTGGEFIVYNNSQTRTYDFGQASGRGELAMHFTAHYADLEHEVKPITSGYRLALVYSLCSSDGVVLNLSKNEVTCQLSNILESLSSSDKPLAIALDHKYTDASMKNSGIMALKGIDAERFKLLKSASSSLSSDDQICFYIAKATLVSPKNLDDCGYGYGYHRYGRYGGYSSYDESSGSDNDSSKILTAKEEEEIESEDEYGYQKTKSLTKWYDAEGNSFFESQSDLSMEFFWKVFDFSDGSCEKINSWMFENREKEYTGNEGNTVTTTYNKYLLAFWSKKSEFSVMARVSLRKALDSIVNNSNELTQTANLRKLLNIMSSNDVELSEDSESEDEDEEEEEEENSIIEEVHYSKPCSSQLRNLDKSFYDKLTSLVINTAKPELVKLFIEILSKQESVSAKVKSVYSIWKASLVRISELRQILVDLVKSNAEDIENFEKLVEMLKELGDTNLIKALVKKAVSLYCGSRKTTYPYMPSYLHYSASHSASNNTNRLIYLRKAVELIVEYKWESISQTFFDCPATYANIIENCNLTQGLVSLKQNEMASICLEKFVLPILDSLTELSKFRSETNSSKSIYKMCETLVMFDRENDLTKFNDLVLVKLSQDQVSSLLAELLNGKMSGCSKLNKSKPITELFTNRLRILENKLNDNQVSWVMSGSIRGHPQVEAFLRSEQRQMIYRGSGMPSGSFQQRTTADNFVRNFSGLKTGYSVEMTVVKEQREKPYVIVNKTTAYADSVRAVKKANYSKEINTLKSFFK